MSQYLPLFPSSALSGFPIHKKPTFASIINSSPSGREVTGQQQIFALWEFDLPFEILRDQNKNQIPFPPTLGFTDMQVLSTFWISRVGQTSAFIYLDPSDCTRLRQEIGVGDGAATNFQVVRTFGSGLGALTEPVGIVDVRIVPQQAINIYFDGVLQSPTLWAIGADLRTLEFVSAPAAAVAISADFGFFYLCRFVEDSLDLEEFSTGRWLVKSLKFRSIRPGRNQTYTIDGMAP